ncbi:TM2 domain-containing protein [Flavobacterium gelatinilyticum]|uniref:TM2 domain-containing protein n=1 Tax=Flavobacterium gelatinilyticum TaxID=3003260 RepID=UPI00248100B8|nr:TM2 domain-containing protein [Flavobacterium gelatinilyticum]
METTKQESWNTPSQPSQENKKVLAGVLGILFGGFGVHKFVLGYTQEGIIQLVISVVTCGIGSFIGLIEGIIYLTKSDEEFYQTYQVGKKGWF